MDMMYLIKNSEMVPYQTHFRFYEFPIDIEFSVTSKRFVKGRDIYTICPGDKISSIVFEAYDNLILEREKLKDDLFVITKKSNKYMFDLDIMTKTGSKYLNDLNNISKMSFFQRLNFLLFKKMPVFKT